MLFQKLNSRKGFTLIEVMIVIAIIIILTAVFSPHIYSLIVDKTITQQEKMLNEEIKPPSQRKEPTKEKEGMTKL